MEFSRQECWSGLPFPSLGIFPTHGLNLGLLMAGGFFNNWATWEATLGFASSLLNPTLVGRIWVSADLMTMHLNSWLVTGEFLQSWVLFTKWWFSCRKPVEGNSPWMYVTMMMTDQIPLELPPLLNGEVAMMPHLVNGDAAQQVGALREDLSCPSGKH